MNGAEELAPAASTFSLSAFRLSLSRKRSSLVAAAARAHLGRHRAAHNVRHTHRWAVAAEDQAARADCLMHST